jgi:hypothetical protein
MTRFRVYPDDVMVTIMGTVGRCAIAPADLPEAISTKHLCVITPNKSQVLPTFLWASILSDPTIRAQTKAVGKGAIMEGWNSKIIRALKFRLPPLDLQRAFEKQVNEILALESCTQPSDALAKSLTASLSAHAFTGQLTKEWRTNRPRANNREHLEEQLRTMLRSGLERSSLSLLKSVLVRRYSPLAVSLGTDVSTRLDREQNLLLKEIYATEKADRLPRYFTAHS